MSQQNLGLKSKATASVECLGQTFPNEEARREHFLKLLAAKLKDPEFRKIEGFPTGKDEDILALSDPPFYTACPNPFLSDFLATLTAKSHPHEPVVPYAGDLEAESRHPVYSFHPYHTKVPPEIIRTLLEHYTKPGDVVLDAFCGSGMTGVAAEECGRRALLFDLSPVAAFIAAVNTRSHPASAAKVALERILTESRSALEWVYQTEFRGRVADVNYFVWSDVFTCPECVHEFPFFPHGVIHHGNKVETRKAFPCPSCNAELNVRRVERLLTTDGKKKSLVWVNAGRGKARVNRPPNEHDLAVLKRLRTSREAAWYPTDPVDPNGYSAKLAQLGDKGLTDVSRFLSERNRLVYADLWHRISIIPDTAVRNLCRACLTSIFTVVSERQGYFGGGGMSGNLYMPIVRMEKNIFDSLERKIGKMVDSEAAKQKNKGRCFVSTQSATTLSFVADESIDYIYTDPPFGANIIYSEMNLLLEAWMRVRSNEKPEAVINASTDKDFNAYGQLMRSVFCEYYRILKPGRWITVEFHNTMASVWNLIQTALSEAGFVVAQVGKLDKGSTTILADIRPGAVVQDLIIAAYKPNGGLEQRFAKRGESEDGAWDFIKTHLGNLPVVKPKGGQLEFIAERDPRILYDRMVAFYVQHATPVPLNSGEFQAGLAQKFPIRDEMYFLPEQVNEYDRKRQQMESVGQMSIFVDDERSAIAWIRNFLTKRPSEYKDIAPDFMQQLKASWKKWEARPELQALLEQNFLRYDGKGEVPSQIHGYLSTQFKELRNLAKDSTQLQERAKDRWYVPDPKKNIDVEKLRTKRLLEEFWSYLPSGYSPAALSANRGDNLPGLTVPVPKIPKGKKLKELRTEAVRVGFKHCYQAKDYQTILVVAEMLPESVIQEDEALQMYYDTAVTRTGAQD